MKQVLTLKLAGNAGVNYDLEPCDLDPNFFTGGNDFALRYGKIYTITHGNVFTTPTSPFGAAQLMFVTNGPTSFYVVAGLTAIYCYTGTAWVNISSAAGYAGLAAGDQFKWTCCKLGNIPVFNNPISVPEYWSPQSSAQVMQPIMYNAGTTWAAKGWHCQAMRAHKNFLFALNMIEGGVILENNYRWSTAADNNGLPFTWDESDLAGIAGSASLLGNTGGIVDGLTLRDNFMIYSSYGVTSLRYIGGTYIWEALTLSSTQGVLNRNCIADIYGRHVFLSNNDILMTDGNSIKSIAYGVVLSKLKGLINPSKYHLCYCTVDHANKEVWFCVPIQESTFPNVAFVYNWVEDKMSMRDIDVPIAATTFGSYAFASSTWASLTRTWVQAVHSWDYNQNSPFAMTLVGVDSSTSSLHNLNTAEAPASEDFFLERVSAQLTDEIQVSTILRVFPHVRCAGSVAFQFGSQMTINSPIVWTPEIIFNPNTERKMEIRTTGALHSWAIRAVNVVNFVYAGMDIEYIVNGER